MGKITFPQYRKTHGGIEISPGLTILEHAQQAEIEINAECGGNGTCGKCIVRIDAGRESLNQPSEEEKGFHLNDNERLACQARVINSEHDVVVFIRSFGKYEILKRGLQRKIPLAPLYTRQGDAVLRDGRPVGPWGGHLYGLAIDVGTTTLVFDLVDLETGNVLATKARTNPQISYGNDVISRIEYTLVDREKRSYLPPEEQRTRVSRLQALVIGAINESLDELARTMGFRVGDFIYDAVIAGNPTMRNLFFDLDVASLGVHPFEPAHKEAVTVRPADLCLQINPAGQVYGAALVGGHIGADTLANVLASEIYRSDDVCMIVDIGTNGEIVLGNKKRLLSASAAAGGAFEGATLSCGVGAIEGAIKEIRLVDGRIVYSTIGNKYPVGVCGSGFIDLAAELLSHELLSTRARLREDFAITGDMKVTQQDIFQLVTSKAAVKTAEEILMKLYPVALPEIKRIYLSGGFGNFIKVPNAVKLGILPPVEEARVVKIGNGSLEGAREMLVCRACRVLSEEIAGRIEHVRTNEAEPDFDYVMAQNMYFE